MTTKLSAEAEYETCHEDYVYAVEGDLVFKPRDQRHTYWNAGDGPCRILEIISPGGFEHLFREAAPDLHARYGLEMDFGSVERLCELHGLAFPTG